MGGSLSVGRQGLERGFPDPRLPLGQASSPCQAPHSSKGSQSHRVCSPWESAETEAGEVEPRPEPWLSSRARTLCLQEPRDREAGLGLGWERQGVRGDGVLRAGADSP